MVIQLASVRWKPASTAVVSALLACHPSYSYGQHGVVWVEAICNEPNLPLRHPALQCLSGDLLAVCSAGAHDDPRHAGISIPQQHAYRRADDPHPDLMGPQVRLIKGARERLGQGGGEVGGGPLSGGLSCKSCVETGRYVKILHSTLHVD